MGFKWRLYLMLLTLSFTTKGGLWQGLRLGCSQCWHLHRFFSAQLSSSLAPRGGGNWFQELLGIFSSFTDIFPSPLKKHTQPSTHKAFPFPLRSLTDMYHELNSEIHGIHIFEGYILKTHSQTTKLWLYWNTLKGNKPSTEPILFKCN